MKLILIRHGLTDYNLKKRYCGSKDIALNKIGRAWAKAIKLKLKGLNIDKVFCSDLRRSWQTAKIIFGDTDCRIIRNPALREIDFGEWEGLTSSQILKSFPSTYKKWLKNPFSVDIPSGEKISHFVNRIKKELKKIIKNNSDRTVALVTHSGPMRVILNTVLRIKKEDFWRLRIKPQGVYIIGYKKSSKPQIYEAI